MNPYELILIFDSNLGEEKIGHFVARIEEKIKETGGEVDRVEKWGTRKLAALVRKAKSLTQGYYVLVRFRSAPSAPAELRNFLKVNENVIRYFISRAVAVEAIVEEKKEIAGTPIEPLPVGEIKGEPLGESK